MYKTLVLSMLHCFLDVFLLRGVFEKYKKTSSNLLVSNIFM